MLIGGHKAKAEDPGPEVFLEALGDVARAKGMAEMTLPTSVIGCAARTCINYSFYGILTRAIQHEVIMMFFFVFLKTNPRYSCLIQ